jgi:hypothetical protein
MTIEHRYIAVTESGYEWAPRSSPDDLIAHMNDMPVGSVWPDTGDRYDAIKHIRHETRSVTAWIPTTPTPTDDEQGARDE